MLTVVGVALTPQILRWMGTPAEVMSQSVSYFRYYSWGILFTVMYNIFVGILHAVGDSRHPLYYLIFSTLVNVVLDLLFVAVFHWGVGSAAVATTISQGVSALLCFLYLLRAKDVPYQIHWRQIRFHGSSLREILRFGLPSGVQNSVIALANVVVQSNINAFGAAAMAGCGAYSKLEGFAFLPITCFAQALSTFVGQNLGAGNVPRIKSGVKSGGIMAVLTALAVGMVMIAGGRAILSLFVSGDPKETVQVLDIAYHYLFLMAVFLLVLYLLYVFRSAIQGLGNTVIPMASGIVEFFMRVGAALLLPLFIGQNGIFYAEISAWTGAAALLAVSYFRLIRKY